MGARWYFPAALVLALAALISVNRPRRPAPPPPLPPPAALATGVTLSATIPKHQRIGQKMMAHFSLRYAGAGEAVIDRDQCGDSPISSAIRISSDGRKSRVSRRLSYGPMGKFGPGLGDGYLRLSKGHPCEWDQDINHLFIIDTPGRYVFTTETGPAFRGTPFPEGGKFPPTVGSTLTIEVAPADVAANSRRLNGLKLETSQIPLGGTFALNELAESQDERAIPILLEVVNDPKERLAFESLSGFCDRRRLADSIVADFRQRTRARKHVEVERNAEILATLESWPCADLDNFRYDARKSGIASAKSRWVKTLKRLKEEKN